VTLAPELMSEDSAHIAAISGGIGRIGLNDDKRFF
jgi:hypothetical protein